MAKSHHDVGVAFGKLQSANGSRMHSVHQPTPPHSTSNPQNLFRPACAGVSYRTVVARIVRNTHTGRNELWITPQRYSNSTQRHKGYFESGFRKSHGISYAGADQDIYITPCIDSNTTRMSPDHVHNTIGLINYTLKDVNAPRLREATRRGTVASCLHHAKKTMRNFSDNIPLDLIDADAYYDMQHTIDFLTTTAAIADIDELRAAVKGHLALLETP